MSSNNLCIKDDLKGSIQNSMLCSVGMIFNYIKTLTHGQQWIHEKCKEFFFCVQKVVSECV